MTNIVSQLGNKKVDKKIHLPGVGSRPSLLCTGRAGKDESNVTHFHTTRLAAYNHLLSNVMQSKRFLSHLILTLS